MTDFSSFGDGEYPTLPSCIATKDALNRMNLIKKKTRSMSQALLRV